MPKSQNTNDDDDNASSSAQQPSSSPQKGSSKHLLLIAVAVIIVIAIAVLLFYPIGSGSYAITQNKSLNSTPIYMSPVQVQTILGSPISNYNTSDLYNPNSSINMSYLAGFVPQLSYNATSGWITYATGTNATSNASIEYIDITTMNTSSISSLIGSFAISSVNMTPTTVNSGTVNGFAYTYGAYVNATASFQIVYGWKNSNVALVFIQENPGFLANETTLVGTVANDTP